jgi:hypothetical protein
MIPAAGARGMYEEIAAGRTRDPDGPIIDPPYTGSCPGITPIEYGAGIKTSAETAGVTSRIIAAIHPIRDRFFKMPPLFFILSSLS